MPFLSANGDGQRTADDCTDRRVNRQSMNDLLSRERLRQPAADDRIVGLPDDGARRNRRKTDTAAIEGDLDA
jgi:hypothetical protein